MSKALLLVDALEGAWLENQRDVSVDEVQTELRRLDALAKEQAAEIERLKAQRVPLTEDQIWASDDIMACNSLMGVEFDTLVRVVRATEIAHGIHPLQRLADLSKEIGEKL